MIEAVDGNGNGVSLRIAVILISGIFRITFVDAKRARGGVTIGDVGKRLVVVLVSAHVTEVESIRHGDGSL